MSFHSKRNWRLAAGRAWFCLLSATALAACAPVGGVSSAGAASSTAAQSFGPEADYPVVIGAPYKAGGTSFTPADVLNYDEVGYLAAGTGEGVAGAHHTLPLPSYVEVTSLTSGRTILVRLEQRGPMDSNQLVALSPAAMSQLEAETGTPVRVRRVNPPEVHRTLLRQDQSAPPRMDTPMSLVEVLRRRLPDEGSASLSARADLPNEPSIAQEAATEVEVSQANVAAAPSAESPSPLQTVEIAPSTAHSESFEQAFANAEEAITTAPTQIAEAGEEPASAAPEPVTDGYVVQAAAFTSRQSAQNVAAAIGGKISQSGRFYRVRTGPFATRAQAEASLANVNAAGYSEARIYSTS